MLKDGIPEKLPQEYTSNDFVFYEDRHNGYTSPKPLLCVLKADYNPDGSVKGYNRDTTFFAEHPKEGLPAAKQRMDAGEKEIYLHEFPSCQPNDRQ